MENAGVEINQNAKKSLEDILKEADEKSEGSQGIKVSEAWRYREAVRVKYGLPECGYRWEDPIRYISEAEGLLKENGVQVRGKHEFSTFFKENPGAIALHSGPNVFRDSTVAVEGASDGEWFKLRARANQLAHESVHAFQDIKYPRMPDEEAEREAFYYQMLTPQQIVSHKDDPEFLYSLVNDVIEGNVQCSVSIDQKIN